MQTQGLIRSHTCTHAQELQTALQGLRLVVRLQARADALAAATRKAHECVAEAQHSRMQAALRSWGARPAGRPAAPEARPSSYSSGADTKGTGALQGGLAEAQDARLHAAISAANAAAQQLHEAVAQLAAELGAGAQAERVLLQQRIEEVRARTVCMGAEGGGRSLALNPDPNPDKLHRALGACPGSVGPSTSVFLYTQPFSSRPAGARGQGLAVARRAFIWREGLRWARWRGKG